MTMTLQEKYDSLENDVRVVTALFAAAAGGTIGLAATSGLCTMFGLSVNDPAAWVFGVVCVATGCIGGFIEGSVLAKTAIDARALRCG